MTMNILQGQNKENFKLPEESCWTKMQENNFMCIALPEREEEKKKESHKHTFVCISNGIVRLLLHRKFYQYGLLLCICGLGGWFD